MEQGGDAWAPGAGITRSEAENRALAALANCNDSGPTNQPNSYISPANPSERRGGDELGMMATSNKSTQPLTSNNAEEVCRASAEPTVPSDNASSTAGGRTTALGVASTSGGEGDGVPSGRWKEAHNLIKQNKGLLTFVLNQLKGVNLR